ncbi:MAG: hypothetical protein Q8O76_13120, partial [Chloroflexota bacterium]|nr:hypothetical protein [Chloroflexota bacterium]
FRDPSMRLEQVSLVKQGGSYVWQVRLMERVCGCQGAATLSVAEVAVDPESGVVLGRQLREGVAESILAKEQCGKGCHEKGRSAP